MAAGGRNDGNFFLEKSHMFLGVGNPFLKEFFDFEKKNFERQKGRNDEKKIFFGKITTFFGT
jgi:hypothetical protein